MSNKQSTSTRVRPSTVEALREISGLTGMSQVEIADRLAQKELARLKKSKATKQ